MKAPSHPVTFASALVTALLTATLPCLHAQSVAPETGPAKEEVISLSPFEVSADNTNSYTALNTNSVTRFRAELAKLPVSADVFTEAFIEDIAATSLEDMVVNYGTGAGIGGSDAENTADATRPGDRAANVNVKLRGLDSGGMRVNSFGQGGIDDSFLTERVDVVRGPQSMLQGGVGGGGFVNVVTKQARFNSKFTRLRFRTDDNGSRRGELDYGFGAKRVAFRFSGLLEDMRFSRTFLSTKSQGLYGQVALQLTKSTVARVEVGRKWTQPVNSTNNTTLNMPSATVNGVRLPADPRNGMNLRALLALGQASDIMDGRLTWDNIDSLKGRYFGAERDNTTYEGKIEHRIGKWATLELAARYDDNAMHRANANSFTNLTAPLRNNNPYNAWAFGFQPGEDMESFTRKAYRANLHTEFELFHGNARNQVMLEARYDQTYNKRRSYFYYLADDSGAVIVNQAQITNSSIGRTQMPTQWFSLANGPVEYTLARPAHASSLRGQDGRLYVLQNRAETGVVTPTPKNPLGARGTGSFWDQYLYNDAYNIAVQTDWFGDRFTTLGGYRFNHVENKRYELTDSKRSGKSPGSYNLGANYKLTKSLRAYYGFSSAFNPPAIVQFGPHGDVTDTSKSVGHELGIKFDPKSGIFSGSLSVFQVKSEDEQISIQTALRQDINPPGINGEKEPTQNWINLDRESKGAELILTAQPTRNWQSRVSLAFTDGKVGESKKFSIYYNDEFYTDGRGGVTYGDGTPLLVTVDPSQQSNANAPRQQLTVAMMNDPKSAYFAVLDPESGRITNASALRLNTTSATGATVGTGRTGLPLSAHQLNFTDPNALGGFITVSNAGEPTVGYAQYSANWTNRYAFTEGRLKGVTVNGTAFYRGKNRNYMYTQLLRDSTGTVTGSQRRMFSMPDSLRFDFMVAYHRKLGKRIEWSTQLNINNTFNSYKVVVMPNSNSGDPRTAAFNFEPRTWIWTNSFSF